MKKLVYGVGLNDMDNMSKTIEYVSWNKLFRRAEKLFKRSIDEMNKNISDDFKTFSTFREWCLKQNGYKEYQFTVCENLLNRNNKKFDPENCVFIPTRIARLIRNDIKKAITKISDDEYRAIIPLNNEHPKIIGSFKTRDEALLAYQNTANEYIKELLTEYDGKLDNRAVTALQNFTL